MSKNPVEQALELYPSSWWNPSKAVDQQMAFISGYHAAERDLALTWEDIRKIYNMTVNETIDSLTRSGESCFDEELYSKVLKRFNEERDEQGQH